MLYLYGARLSARSGGLLRRASEITGRDLFSPRHIVVTGIARRRCPHCHWTVLVLSRTLEPHLCPNCLRFFLPAVPGAVPAWIFGVITVLCFTLLV
jgi:hypothetical protein